MVLFVLFVSAPLVAKQVIYLEDYNDCCNSIFSLAELDHETFAAGSYDGTIRVYGLQPNGLYACKAELIGHTAAIISLAKLNNNIFISSSRDKTIRIWKKNIDGLYACKSVFHDPTDAFNKVFRLNDWFFVSYSNDSAITIWNFNENEDFACIKICEELLLSACITAASNLSNRGFVLGSNMGDINVYKNNTNEPNNYKQELSYPPSRKSICSLTHLHNDDLIASCDKAIFVFSLNADAKLYEYKETLSVNNKEPFVCPFDADSFAVAFWDNNPKIDNQWHIKIFEKNNDHHYQCKKIFKGLASEISSIIQLNNGCIVTGEIDGTITILKNIDLEKENPLAV